MQQHIAIDFARPIPLFPLPNCVLLPHACAPLHIFEPRYRKMTNDALDSNGLIAMALFAGQTWRHDYEGSPPLRPIVCVGYIIKHQALPDGRFNILLQGICRAQIIRETPSKPYRTALLKPIEPSPPLEIDLTHHRHKIEELLDDPHLRKLASVSAIHNWLSTEIPTATLVDLAIMTVTCNVEERYAMLAQRDTIARALWLQNFLERTRRTLAIAENFQPAPATDGVFLN